MRRAWLLAITIAVTIAPTASAGTVSTATELRSVGRSEEPFQLVLYRAAAGERNDVLVRFASDSALVADPVGVVAGRGCAQTSPTTARCPLTALTPASPSVATPVAQVTLGEGSDRVLIEGRGPGGMAPRSELTGGEGRDRLEAGAGGGALSGGSGADVLLGGVGPETLRGGPGGDRMAGRGSGDIFVEGVSRDGRDSVSGGDGFDTVSYRFRRKPVRADLAGDRDDGERGERDRIDRDVESLIGSAAGDRLTGNSRPNLLQGSRGNDRIAGRNGPDILQGGRGSDRIFARDGDSDTVTCGRGLDRTSLDGLDHLPAFASCESRRRSSVARAVLAERELMVFGSTATVPVNCPADARPRCRGTLSVLLDGRRIGEGAFSISRGGGDDLEVGLPADVAARIAREGFVRVTVVLRTRYRRLRAVARLGAALVAQ